MYAVIIERKVCDKPISADFAFHKHTVSTVAKELDLEGEAPIIISSHNWQCGYLAHNICELQFGNMECDDVVLITNCGLVKSRLDQIKPLLGYVDSEAVFSCDVDNLLLETLSIYCGGENYDIRQLSMPKHEVRYLKELQ